MSEIDMKLDVMYVMKDLDGKDMGTKEMPITLKKVLVESLMFQDEKATGEQLAERYDLGIKMNGCDTIDLTAEEIVMLKKLAEKRWPVPMIYGQACRLIDPKE